MNFRDCPENWAACPLEKRVWLQNNMEITKRLKEDALRERGYFNSQKDSYTSINSKVLPALGKAAIKAGLYSPSTGNRSAGEMIQRYVERIYGIRRKWLKDGWVNVQSHKKFKRDRNAGWHTLGSVNNFPTTIER